MATIQEHYNEVLSDVYSWMYGGFESNIQRYTDIFNKKKLSPQGSGIAIDLGAGCGFQSIPLAKAGYFVTAIDLDAKLLNELKRNSADLEIKVLQGDLMGFDKDLDTKAELVVCMTDTILHLDSRAKVISLFAKVFAALESGGKFIISFRDLTYELKEIERILPVRSDESTIFTCFLEYEPETVKVHDILYRKVNEEWKLSKSYYRKLRLSKAWVNEELSQAGFSKTDLEVENGLITITASV
ncbi:MAG: class I SAM-dependent methyltransferase [Anaerolineae bacterium]|jgi:predicted RNA methylase|nr:class I SAM-dependent methyltransferase [Anaerolineae bacterium]MBT7075008.1 class I SAM-dependent methyltransferase [Anaerolineae bacterium]MBT7782951.1 class I SAM-dependent methyltransferase [Anaerolineae bacterium]